MLMTCFLGAFPFWLDARFQQRAGVVPPSMDKPAAKIKYGLKTSGPTAAPNAGHN
jgi:hypothetical protein